MNKICTSIEQSKKLIELGVDINTADMCWSLFTVITNGNKEMKQILLPTSYEKITKQSAHYFIERYPAWTLSALLDVLPSSTLDSSNCHYYRLYCMKRFTEWHGNPIDTCVEMIIKLKEKDK